MRLLVTLHLQCLNHDSQRRDAVVLRLPQYELPSTIVWWSSLVSSALGAERLSFGTY